VAIRHFFVLRSTRYVARASSAKGGLAMNDNCGYLVVQDTVVH